MTDITDEEREVAAQVLAEAIFGAPRIDLMAALIPGVDALVAWGWRPASTPNPDNTALIAELRAGCNDGGDLPDLLERAAKALAALPSPAQPGFEPEPDTNTTEETR